tara:strand:- start:284 stop:670 length:387 start_codon:yes stop_codon:yes gene_type:complete
MRPELMVQQQVKSVWQHMVGVICLNLTDRKQVKAVLPKLFKRYPNAIKFIRGSSKTQAKMLKPLGMVNVRLKRLKHMSLDMLTWDYKDATKLYGIGKYGSDSYRIFYKNEIPEDVQDKELKRYINDIK